MKQFDYVVMNPPYQGNLHLQCVQYALPFRKEDGRLLNLSLARWIQDPLWMYKKTCDRKKFPDVRNELTDIGYICRKDAQKLFGIVLDQDLAVYEFWHNKIEMGYGWKDNDFIKSIVHKIVECEKTKPMIDFMDDETREGWRVEVKRIVNSGKAADSEAAKRGSDFFFTAGPYINGFTEEGIDWTNSRSRNQWSKPEGSPIPHSIKFPDKQTAQNFIDSTDGSHFYLNLLHLLKFDAGTPYKFLPMLSPEKYDHIISDIEYCELLGLSADECKFMKRTVDDYSIKDWIPYIPFNNVKSQFSFDFFEQ